MGIVGPLFRRGTASVTQPMGYALEPRIMLDAAALATGAEAAAQADAAAAQEAEATPDQPATAASSDGALRTEVAVIDASVDGYEVLAAGARDAGLSVVLLSGDGDGVAEMADALAGYDGIDALHILSHGDVGSVILGRSTLSADTLDDHAGALERVAGRLSADGDILIYGCRVGEAGAGSDFIDRLAAVTGADVAASDDMTGSAAKDGDWTLEYKAGAVEADEAFDDGYGDFDGVLALPPDGTNLFASFAQGNYATTATGTYFSLQTDGAATVSFHSDGTMYYNSGDSDQSNYVTFTAGGTNTVGTFSVTGLTSPLNYAAGATLTVTFTGYLNNAEQGTTNGTVNSGTTAWASAPNFSSGFSNIDALRVTLSTTGANLETSYGLNGLTISGASAGNTPPTVGTNTGSTLNEGATDTITSAELQTTDGQQGAANLTYTVTTAVTNGSLIRDTNGDGVAESTLGLNATFTQQDIANSYIKYIHNGSETTTDSFGFKVSDGTAEVTGQTFNFTVNAQNDAPVLTSGAYTFSGISEDATSGAVTVSTIATMSDVDTGASAGIAIYSTTGNGTWQYSTDGTNWSAMGTVSANSSLLLRSTDSVRYVGGAQNGETATLNFRGWDQSGATAGQQGTKVATTTNGGTSAFSTNTQSASIVVSGQNDAPSVTATTPTIGSMTEDATASAILVSSFLSSSDVDTGAQAGIAITATSGSGTWEYSTDGGTNWVAVGTVAANSALLLQSDQHIRYTPNTNNAETAQITYRAWDRTTSSAGNKVDATTNGTTTAFSANTGTGSLNVTAVNDAPSLTSGAYTFTGIDENTTSGAVLVSAIATMSDVDAAASAGIAIYGATGNGTWQYSTNGGGSWSAVGTVAANSALLLRSTDSLRYVPDSQNGETATLNFRGWDQSGATAGQQGTKVDTTTNGGTSAFSANTQSASLAVSSQNDAPSVTATTPAVGTTDYLTTKDVTVSSFLSSSDVDTGAQAGIAITATTGNGTWRYSTDGGTNWTDVGAVAGNSALLLRSTDQLRYVPDNTNQETPQITFRAWDRTSGTQGTKVDATTNGGTTAFSSNTGTGTLTVGDVNDAPVLTGVAPTLAGTNENTTGNAILVSSFLNSTDADAAPQAGIAITATTGNGTWQYTTDGGTTWTAVGAVTGNASLLLRSTDSIRYVPDNQNAETPTLTYRAWDRTSGTQGDTADTTTNGGKTAFSTATLTASLPVSAVNDAPSLTATAPSLGSTTEDATTSAITVSSFLAATDVDTGAAGGIAITGVSEPGTGAWQYSTDGGTNWTAVGTVAANSALLLQSDQHLRFVPDGTTSGTASLTYRAWDRTTSTAGNKVAATTVGGSTAFSTNTGTASLSITAVNDAPDLTSGAYTFTGVNEETTTNAVLVSAIASMSDADTGASAGIAIYAATGNGAWQYTTDGGTTWTAVGAVTANSALLLRSTDSLRFVPDGKNSETATLNFRGWDQSGATAGQQGTKVDVTTNGGITAFSADTQSASLAVSAQNDAPSVTATAPTIGSMTEDATASAIAVSSFLSSSDVDSGASAGIAITGTSGSGTWEYSTDGGTHWTAIGTVAGNNALLLQSDQHVRYTPNTNNAETAQLTYRAWDRTTGVAGNKVDATTTGGTTAFSTNTGTGSLTVTAVNDAPVLTPQASTLTGITEDTAATAAQTVSGILSLADPDTGAVAGIAISAASGNGAWQYSTDGGTTWTNVGTVSASSALLLQSDAQVRFQPDGLRGGTATLTFRGWDRSTGTQGTKVATTTTGGVSAFSTATDTLSVAVSDVNDAPISFVLSNAKTPAEGSSGGTVVGDLSATDPEGQAITYSVVSDPSNNFAVVGNQLVVKAGATLDFEAASFHTVVLRATDASGATTDLTHVVRVGDVPEQQPVLPDVLQKLDPPAPPPAPPPAQGPGGLDGVPPVGSVDVTVGPGAGDNTTGGSMARTGGGLTGGQNSRDPASGVDTMTIVRNAVTGNARALSGFYGANTSSGGGGGGATGGAGGGLGGGLGGLSGGAAGGGLTGGGLGGGFGGGGGLGGGGGFGGAAAGGAPAPAGANAPAAGGFGGGPTGGAPTGGAGFGGTAPGGGLGGAGPTGAGSTGAAPGTTGPGNAAPGTAGPAGTGVDGAGGPVGEDGTPLAPEGTGAEGVPPDGAPPAPPAPAGEGNAPTAPGAAPPADGAPPAEGNGADGAPAPQAGRPGFARQLAAATSGTGDAGDRLQAALAALKRSTAA